MKVKKNCSTRKPTAKSGTNGKTIVKKLPAQEPKAFKGHMNDCGYE